jgi:putative transposase
METSRVKINLAYKFKLIPTHSQQQTFSSWAGSCRFTYNLGLEHRIFSWEQYRKSVNYYDQANQLKEMKKTEGFEWLKETPAQLLQQSFKDLDKAFKSFWKSSFGFPKYKKKGLGESFRFPDPKQFSIEQVSKKRAFVKLPKIGKIKFRLSQQVDGLIKNATVRKESDGWYISFCCEKELNIKSNENSSIGIDRGISQTIALSDESNFSISELELPKSCIKLREQIKFFQRKLRLKVKFSKNWQKLQRKIRKLHSKISRIRRDFLHKTSTKLSKNHGLVTLENLKIKNMSKSAKGNAESHGRNVKAKSGLNREILFQGWGLFAAMLEYKTFWNGGSFELVNPKMTSRRCSECLFESKDNRKGKLFLCLSCGHKEDADINAAKNINRAGQAQRDCGAIAVKRGYEAITSSCA